jgi:Protein of unknown function (DUF2470)
MSHPGNTTRITDSPDNGRGTESTEVRSAHGQPRPRHGRDHEDQCHDDHHDGRGGGAEIARMPSAAERTRTLVQGTCSAVVLVPGLGAAPPYSLMPEDRTVDAEGNVLLSLPADSPVVRAAAHAQDDDLGAVLEVTDVAPVSVPHRVRGRAWVSGWLTPLPGRTASGAARLRLETGEVVVDDLWGAGGTEVEAFAAARPDPLAPYEAELLQHLHAAHAHEVGLLASLLCDRADGRPAAGTAAVPIALDRLGLRVRFVGSRTFDARFDFPEPVEDVTALRGAMHRLFRAAAR